MCVSKRKHAITCLRDQEGQGLQQTLINSVRGIRSLRGNAEGTDLTRDYYVQVVSLLGYNAWEICRFYS